MFGSLEPVYYGLSRYPFFGGKPSLVLFIISRILLDIRMDLFSGGYGFIFLLFYFTQLIILIYTDLQIKIILIKYPEE
jgi:hypothetical protein